MNAEHMPLHYGNECTATLKGKGNTCSCHYSDNDERTVATYTMCMDKVVHWAYTHGQTLYCRWHYKEVIQYPSFSRNESQLYCLNKKHMAVCTYSPTFRLTQTMPVSLQ